MNVAVTLAVLSVMAGTFSQRPGDKELPTVERLCGKLVHSEKVSVKGHDRDFTTKERNLAHAPVRLYSALGDGACCEGRTAASTTTTGHWGGFELKSKGLIAGPYWLEVESNGQKHTILILYSPKKNSDQLCTDTVWELDSEGNLSKQQFIIVD